PLLLLALVVWLARGAPRPLVAGLAAAALAVVLLVAIPFEAMSTLAATPSAFSQIPLYELTSHVNLDLAVPLVAAVLLAACAAAPLEPEARVRRRLPRDADSRPDRAVRRPGRGRQARRRPHGNAAPRRLHRDERVLRRAGNRRRAAAVRRRALARRPADPPQE